MLSLDAAVLSAKVISGPASERKIKLGPDATVPPVKEDTAAAAIKKRGPIGH